MKQKGILNLFTSRFPFGEHENFLEREILFLAEEFQLIRIFPFYHNSDDVMRALPENVEVILLEEKSFPKTESLMFTLNILMLETGYTLNIWKNISKNFYTFLSWSRVVHNRFELLKKFIQKDDSIKSQHFYSYWMNEWAVILALLKKDRFLMKFIYRVHGFDLFQERNKEGFVFVRKLCEDKVSFIVTACDYASNYLISSAKVESKKVKRFYLGVRDAGMANFDRDRKITIVSCSNIIPLKRVYLIPEILQKLNVSIKWVHIGAGVQMNQIKDLVSKLPVTCEVELLGRKENSFINDYYQSNNVHLFLHLSETEGGVPVVLQEAGMAGVPLIAVNVGGVSEIVNFQTGVLIGNEFTTENVAEEINSFLNSPKNSIEFRKGVRDFVKQNFYDKENYNVFIKELF